MINSVTLVGNLGAKPEMKTFDNGTVKGEFRIACNEIFNSNGQKVERTHWFSCEVYGRTAEICGQYLKKGSRVGIRGSLNYREWQDEKGMKRNRVVINVRDLEFLDARGREKSGQQTPCEKEPF